MLREKIMIICKYQMLLLICGGFMLVDNTVAFTDKILIIMHHPLKRHNSFVVVFPGNSFIFHLIKAKKKHKHRNQT